MQRFALQFFLALVATSLSQAGDGRQLVFTTISGPIHNAVVYAPTPPIRANSLPRQLKTQGLFKLDLDNGTPYDVRVIRSTGYKILDDAAVETLRRWRFAPHRLVWATIPLAFYTANSSTQH